MKHWLLALLLCLSAVRAHAVMVYGQCSTTTGVTAGTLTLRVGSPRTTGISPLHVFFDATTTTDTATLGGANTAFQDIEYNWAFGDTQASGTDTWAYGSNPGHNSKNSATGAVASHLYITTRDRPYTVIVSAFDGTNTAVCGLAVTAYDPSGVNGFPTTATACVAASTTPAAGVSGCPAGAAVLQQANYATALTGTGGKFGAGKRVLFKCGDTFAGSDTTLTGLKWAVGAYGGCEGTQTGRPIFNTASTSIAALMVATTAQDGRIQDLDFEGGGSGGGAIDTPATPGRISSQITLWNLRCAGNHTCYSWAQGAQWALVGSVQSAGLDIACYVNYSENNPPYSGNPFNNLDFQALLGNLIQGPGGSSTRGIEACRISAGRLMMFENNDFRDATNSGAPLKIHGGNTNGSCGVFSGNPCGTSSGCTVDNVHYFSIGCWTGAYTELLEISDNLIAGQGANAMETAPQNDQSDERLRLIVFERNVIAMSTVAQGGLQFYLHAVNETVRNNGFNLSQTSSTEYPQAAVGVGQRGPYAPVPTFVEVYNNTCFSPQQNHQTCVVFGPIGDLSPGPNNSFAQNNLFYDPAGATATVSNSGTGNTISNNTTSVATNPGFTNGSGTMGVITDFKPTANYSGGAPVPVWSDALGIRRSSTDIGAVQH